MTATLGKIAADFSTTLNLKTAIGATSATLDSATDDDGVALPTGTYFLTLDRKSANKEYIKGTVTGTAVTDIYHVSRQGALTSGATKTHRKGATVEITDFAIIKKMLDLLDGTTDLNASVPLKYDGSATISNANHLATKAYVDGVAIAGGADASTTVKGITKLSVAPASAANPIAVGDNDNRVSPVSLAAVTADVVAALDGTGTPNGTTGKYVTNDDTSATSSNDKVYRLKANGKIDATMLEGNLPALNGAALTNLPASQLLFSSTTQVTSSVANTNENTLITQNIAANLLGTTHGLRFKCTGTLQSNGAARTLRIRLKYGATAAYDETFTMDSGTTAMEVNFEVLILAAGATNSQVGTGIFRARVPKTTVANTAFLEAYKNDRNTLAEDSTGILALALTTQLDNTASACTLQLDSYTIELL